MNKKILFWIDDGWIHFGISKYLQEKYPEYDLYAIFDTNYITKKFFEKQKIVNFKKSWFFRDHLSNKPKKINVDYLQTFEKKYKINLWQLAFSERKFFRYNNYHKFTYEEILSISEEESKFFESVLNEINPDFVMMIVTDLHRNHLFSEICRASKINILILSPSRFGYRASISSDFDKIDGFDEKSVDYSNMPQKSEKQLQEYVTKYDTRGSIDRAVNREFKLGVAKILKRHLEFLLFICNNKYREFYGNWGITRFKFLTQNEFMIPFIIKRWYRGIFLNKNSKLNIEPNQPFIYYPLQHEPERTLLLDAPYYTNQIELITNIAKSIPAGYKLYVKEHFSMKGKAWRETSYYKKIKEIPNVVLIHPSANTEQILKNCSLILTLTGFSGLEAAFYKKPSIVFGKPSYYYLPFVHRIKNIEDLPRIIRECLEKKFDFSYLNHYIKLIHENSFDFDWVPLTQGVAKKIHHYNGMTKEVEVTESKIKSFLQEYRNDFEILVTEYMKKIKNK